MRYLFVLQNDTTPLLKKSLLVVFFNIFLVLFFAAQKAAAQLPAGFEALEQARVVKRINIRQVAADGIIRLFDEHCTLGAHVAGVRLVYARNDHKSLQGQDWSASLSYDLLRPQDKNNPNNSDANVAIESGISLAIGEQTTAPYLQTFIDAKTHTLDYSSLALPYSYYDADLRIKINGLPLLSAAAPDAIWLELELYESSTLPFRPSKTDYHFLARQAGTDIVVAWDYVETAYEYELEWVWIDKAETQEENPDSDFDETWIDNDPKKIFEYREGVNVQTTDQHFIFPNTFLEGRVFYRLRAIGRFLPENVPQYGDWNYSYNKYNHTKTTAKIEVIEDYQTDHNWQSVTSFAENAKYKTVVSYHDGTGRNRQVVTHLSSEKRTLIAETLYDYEGNPTVNILPVSLEGTNLSYHENLNPFDNADPFSKDNYDNGSTSTALSTTSGAAQYYSANNTSGGRYAERLPDAEGFAYSRTTYLRDGTGRVREQGGLGATYQVGSAHSTKMYYGSTNDTELKRLFGDNVGKASFYRKQITEDPNGQLSVSYLDAAGQVIATALTGEVPENVLALESYDARTIAVDLKENNLKDELNRRSLSENTIFNNIPGTEYSFTYSVDGKTSTFMSKCLSCQYELSIGIYDENGEGVDFKDATGTVFATGLFTQTIDPASCSIENYGIDFKVILPEIGTYQVRKELQVISNENLEDKLNELMVSFENTAYTKYEQEALANNPCDICFTCFPQDYNPLELFEGMDCESILLQIQVKVDDGTYPDVQSHPEYCHYEACADFTTSKTFALEMSRVFDWTDASTKYGLPTTTPANEQTALENFVNQDPLFVQHASYKNQLVTALLELSAFNGEILSDAQNPTISIWEFIDPTVTLSSHPVLFDNGENMPFQGIDVSDNAAVAEHKWDLFRSRYLYEYEKVKEDILHNEYGCDYVEDQDIAIVKDPTKVPENDAELQDFEDDFNTATAPNCEMQVQLWMGQLQNSCDNLTSAEWATIKTQLEGHCATMTLNPQENPLQVLFANDPLVASIKDQIETACTNADLSSLMPSSGCEIYGDLPSDPSSAVAMMNSGAIYLPLINTIPTAGNNDFELSFWLKAGAAQFPKALFKLGNLQITQQTVEFVNGEATKQKLYFNIAGNQAETIINGSCTFVRIKVFHTTDVHGTTRWIRYEFSDNEENWTSAGSDQIFAATSTNLPAIDFGNKIELGVRGNGIYEPTNSFVWNVKLEKGNTYDNIFDFNFTSKTTLGHWSLKGSNAAAIQDQSANNNGNAYKIATAAYPSTTIDWSNFCCQTDNAFIVQVSLQQEKAECKKRFKEIGKKDAQIIIDRKRNELRAELTAKYTQNCLATNETFTYSYTTAEHHYTLYYYDQAGNLVQTVSPEGVRPDGSDNHKLKTRYAYNSLNAPIDQETPDAGKSEFFYDKVARIRLSQNAQQTDSSFYSYTKYDAQGRISEVGQLEKNADGTNPVINELLEKVDLLSFPSQTDYILTQITRTFYDDEATGTPTQITPKNLRGRIAAVKVFEDGQTQGAATFYDYDIHGNVEKLVQSLPELEPKTVEYSYDLLSGNVHRVTYQKGEEDQFMHRYAYDADNRLEAVFTSSDGYIWDEDARYLYYAHGPMARVELGEYKVQGVDYYYTLQGWIKGVNLQGDHDAEATNNVQKYVSKDAFGYALHYYQNDYQSINGNFGWNSSNTSQYKNLYNGNIASMKTTLSSLGELVRDYKYDQLHRIREANSVGNAYKETFTYDANGNIKTNTLHNSEGNQVDNATYHYFAQTNKLHYISDSYGETQAGFDLMNQTSGNFAYDLIGNLVKDKAMQVSSMSWTAYHKREKVVKENQDGTITTITYRYDAMNNRIYKKAEGNGVTETTHYLRDGTGNTLAIYKNGELEELNIYGSSRLGTYNGKTDKGKRTLGNKRYELSNHLGNALVIITDNKIGIDSDADLVADSYIALVVSERDYLAFGAVMAGRSVENEDYTYSFNGKELDPATGWQDYGFRDYNPVYKRFDRVDPLTKKYPFYSPYQFAGNKPVAAFDLDGLEPDKNSPHYGRNIALVQKNEKELMENPKMENEFWLPFYYDTYDAIDDVLKLLSDIRTNNNDPNFKAKNVIVAAHGIITVETHSQEVVTHNGIETKTTSRIVGSLVVAPNVGEEEGFTISGSIKGIEIGSGEVEKYIKLKSKSDKGKKLGKKQSAFMSSHAGKYIAQLDLLMSNVEDNGNLVLVNCYIGQDETLMQSFSDLSEGRINIYMSDGLSTMTSSVYTISLKNETFFKVIGPKTDGKIKDVQELDSDSDGNLEMNEQGNAPPLQHRKK